MPSEEFNFPVNEIQRVAGGVSLSQMNLNQSEVSLARQCTSLVRPHYKSKGKNCFGAEFELCKVRIRFPEIAGACLPGHWPVLEGQSKESLELRCVGALFSKPI